jgi:hypothetical protein
MGRHSHLTDTVANAWLRNKRDQALKSSLHTRFSIEISHIAQSMYDYAFLLQDLPAHFGRPPSCCAARSLPKDATEIAAVLIRPGLGGVFSNASH